ncbi:MAG: citrate/2-methylcitrate synthase, partial [Candidatus Saccharimonadales bacterium]
ESEVVIPVVDHVNKLGRRRIEECTAVVNAQSARRVLSSSISAIDSLPNLHALVIFAEHTPESHTRELAAYVSGKDILILGPSSVGLLIPGSLKLGAIGGTQHEQLSGGDFYRIGDTAVVSTSGGMVNELIHTVGRSGLGVSFAIALGGDRFPVLTPAEAILLAEKDKSTERTVFFGELGGTDEYEIAGLVKGGKIKKEVIAYVAGTVAELFEKPPQFGHAKALAQSGDETATAKKRALKDAGVTVCDTFGDIEENLKKYVGSERQVPSTSITVRKKSLILSHVSGDINGNVQLIGNDLLTTVQKHSVASLYASLLLGHEVRSKKLDDFFDFCLRLLVDHGPYVSGALNTIVSARAGKDLVSSLVTGLLTIGPRFGGAINGAADGWLNAVADGSDPKSFVGTYTKQGGIIPGIGHKKYRIDNPDPRVAALIEFAGNTNDDRYLTFARSVEQVTVTKKSNLILNVDGAIAAIMLDILESELDYDHDQLQELIDIEFFNALFVLSRSVGFTAHYLDQRRHDEGLLRLPDDDVRYLN